MVKTGLIYVPTIFACQGGIARLGNLEPEVGGVWMPRVRALSGNYTSASIVCNDWMIKALKSNDLRSSIVRLNTFTGIGINAIRAAVISDLRANTNDDQLTFVDANFSEAVGLTGTGTKIMFSGVKQSDLYAIDSTNHSFTYGAYVCTSTNQSGFSMGVYNGSDYCYLYVSNVAGRTTFSTGISANQIDVADSAGTGFYCGSYNTTTDAKIYKRGAQFGTSATPGATINAGFWVGIVDVNNQDSGGVAPSTKTFGGYMCGRGIAAPGQAILNDIWKRGMGILGRTVS